MILKIEIFYARDVITVSPLINKETLHFEMLINTDLIMLDQTLMFLMLKITTFSGELFPPPSPSLLASSPSMHVRAMMDFYTAILAMMTTLQHWL